MTYVLIVLNSFVIDDTIECCLIFQPAKGTTMHVVLSMKQ